MPQAAVAAIGAAASSAVGAAIAGQTIAWSTVLAQAAIAGALAQASSMMFKPDPAPTAAPFARQAQDRKFAIRSPASAGRLVYGRTRISGVLPLVESTGAANRRLHMVLALSHRPVKRVGRVFFNEEPADAERYRPVAKITAYDGTQTAADPALVAAVAGWTSAHVGRGCPYLYLDLEHREGVWLSGIPNVSAILDGHELYDPRDAGVAITASYAGTPGLIVTAVAHGLAVGQPVFVRGHAGAATGDTKRPRLAKAYRVGSVPAADRLTLIDDDFQPVALTAGGVGGAIAAMKWSENAALCILDYMLSSDGMACEEDWEIDWPSWVAAANRCDQLVATPGAPRACQFARGAAAVVPIEGWINQPSQEWSQQLGEWLPTVTPVYTVTGYQYYFETSADMPFEAGDAVRLISSGEVPPPFVQGQTYYAIRVGERRVALAATRAYALAGWAITPTGPGSGGLIVQGLDRFVPTTPLGGAPGQFVQIAATGSAPAPLVLGPDGAGGGYLIPSDIADSFQLAATYGHAIDGEAMVFSSLGSGALTARRAWQRRYSCNGAVELGPKRRENLERLLSTCNGEVSWSESGFRLHVGGPDAPAMTITEDMLAAGAIDLDAAPPIDRLFNVARGLYAGPATRYEASDYPEVGDPAWIAIDGEALQADVNLPLTNDDMMAQRIVRVMMAVQHQGLALRMPFDQSVFGVEPGDVVALDMPRYGFAMKPFRVRRVQDGAPGKSAVILDLKEEAAEAWEIGPEELVEKDYAPNTRLPSPLTSALPPALGPPDSGDEQLLELFDGTLISRIRLPLTPPADGYVRDGGRIEIRYRKVTAASEGPWTLHAVEGDASAAYLTGVEDRATYEIQARSVNSFSVKSAWSPHLFHLVIGKTAPPPDVPRLFREGDRAVWSYPALPRDFAGFRIRTLAGRTRNWSQGADWPSAGGLIAAREIDLAAVGDGVQTIMVKAVDAIGNLSLRPAVLTLGLGHHGPANLLFTQDEKAAGFPGAITAASVDPSGALVADDTGDLYLPADDALYLPEIAAAYLPVNYGAAAYEFAFAPHSADAPADVFLLADIDGEGWRVEYRRAGDQGAYLGADEEVYLADDGPYLDGPTDWRPVAGVVRANRERLHFRVALEPGARRGRIAALSANIDVPDIVESFEDLVIPAGGARLPITKSYRAIKAIGEITLQDDGFGATNVVVVDMDASLGPLLKAVGASQATIDIHQMKGY
ncbi:MAG: phage tail protein [Alphaproteobacteria bacterium]|nr:phage tail protein [Alphaproteobacteria bacterium]